MRTGSGWRALTVAAASGLALGCSAPSATSGTPAADAEPAFTPYGPWLVVSVNGVEARAAFAESPPPSVTFDHGTYGGNGGCNGFGGVGVWVDGRWYGDSPMMTAMACRDVMDQEATIAAVLASAPSIQRLDDERIEVTSARGTLVLAMLPVAADGPPPGGTPPPALLAGRRWALRAGDGVAAFGTPPAMLAFAASQWTLTSACGTSTGAWHQDGRALALSQTRIAESCATDGLHQATAGLAAGEAGFATGTNGELVMGGSGHWVLGWQDLEADDAVGQRLAGSWQGVRLNGAALPPGDTGVRVAFAPGGYALWDGCNQTEGVALVSDGALFTAGSGVSTLSRCDVDETRTAARAVVLDSPRVTWTEDGLLVLVSRGGTLRLRRLDARAFGSGTPRRLQPGQVIALSGIGTLNLQSGRFTLTTDCAEMAGQWRGGATPRFSSDPPHEIEAGCDLGPGSATFRASQILTGDVQAVVDANGERVLIVNREDSLTGRLQR